VHLFTADQNFMKMEEQYSALTQRWLAALRQVNCDIVCVIQLFDVQMEVQSLQTPQVHRVMELLNSRKWRTVSAQAV